MNLSRVRLVQSFFSFPCSSHALVETCTLFVNFDLECGKASMYFAQNYPILRVYVVKSVGVILFGGLF